MDIEMDYGVVDFDGVVDSIPVGRPERAPARVQRGGQRKGGRGDVRRRRLRGSRCCVDRGREPLAADLLYDLFEEAPFAHMEGPF